MYSWLYRRLPGSTPTKVALAALLAVLVVAVLMLVVFPWIEPHVPTNRVTVDG